MTSQQTDHHFPLEGELQADRHGALRRQLLDELSQQAGAIKRALDGGVAPADFERARRLHAAFAAGTTVVEKVWQRFHPA